MLKYLETEDFKEITKDGIVLVDFFATWCGPCKMLGPVLESMQEEAEIVKVDVDKHNELAREYKVMSVPTMIIFKDGKPAKQIIGFRAKEDLLEEINLLK
jgi:thioredoxin 1